jgi:hypothetical protein
MRPSELPVEDFFEVFLAGDVARGGGETDISDLATGLSPEPGGLAKQLGGGNVGQVALSQFILNAAEVAADLLPALLPAGEALFGQSLGFDRPEVLDIELVFAAPLNESGLGDVELSGDFIVAQAVGAQMNKLRDGFLIFHN